MAIYSMINCTTEERKQTSYMACKRRCSRSSFQLLLLASIITALQLSRTFAAPSLMTTCGPGAFAPSAGSRLGGFTFVIRCAKAVVSMVVSTCRRRRSAHGIHCHQYSSNHRSDTHQRNKNNKHNFSIRTLPSSAYNTRL